MHELDDNALLRQYAEHNSETAFAALVVRHVDKVYSVALRHTRNAHAAEEITQAVFVILAKKSGRLGAKVILAGWLYETARLTALTYIRSEIRRARREQEAHMTTALNENDAEAWPHIAPLLDDALAKLSAAERHAIVLRYFDGKSLGEVGAALGASEAAAKKRVARAVEKLRGWFTQRGVMLTATVLTAAIAANSVQAAPVGLAKTISVIAITKGATASGSTLALAKGALKIMAWTKMKTAIVVGVGVLLAAGTTAVVVEETSQPFDPWANIGSYSKELRELVHKHYVEKAKPVALNNKEANKAHTEMGKRHEDEINSLFQRFSDKAPAGVIIRPTQFSEGQTGNFGDGKHVLASKRMPFSMLFLAAEEIGPHHNMISPARMILPEGVPSGNYDVLVNAPGHNFEQVQAQIKRQFGLTWQVETRVTNVLALTVQNPAAPGLQPNAEVSLAGDRSWNAKMLADSLEERFHWRIVDTTKLEDSQSYSFVVPDKPADLDAVKKTLHDVYGLELVPTNMPIEMLVVEKAK